VNALNLSIAEICLLFASGVALFGIFAKTAYDKAVIQEAHKKLEERVRVLEEYNRLMMDGRLKQITIYGYEHD